MPKYSFIVPVYNCGPYLMPCVESLLAQTVRDFEILLIDDGTPDDCGAVCDRLAAEFDCVRAFHKENGGAASARNYGIEWAAGEYLLFVDGDDTLDHQYLEQIDRVLRENSVDLVISAMSFDYYERDKLHRVEILGWDHACVMHRKEWENAFKKLFDRNCVSSACSKVFSAERIRANRLRFDENLILYEDLNFSVSYLRHAERIALLPDGFYHYRIRLDANRYNSRISDVGRVNGMMAVLEQSMRYLNPVFSYEIQSSILEQIAQESLKVLVGNAERFCRKASEFYESAEFQRICHWHDVTQRNIPRIFSLIRRKQYGMLWVWIVYRKWKRFVRAFIKQFMVRKHV